MAIYSGTMTMGQYAVLSNEPLVEAVTFSLIDNGSVMARDIPFTSKQTLIANGVRFEGNLPTVNWSQLNAEGVVSIGTPKAYQEAAYTLRNYIDVDKRFVQDQNQIADPRATQLAATLKSIAYDFNDKFINNDHIAGNANAPVGIKYRVSNGGTFGVRPENNIDGAGVDMTLATLTTAASKDSGNKFLELLDQLLWSVDADPTGQNVVLYMNEVMVRRFNTALRALGTDGGLEITTDQFGRKNMMFRSAKVVDIGYKADQSTRIIPSVESAAGAATGGTFTSVYAVNYGPAHFGGWQFEPLQAQDLGLLNNGVIYRTLIDWAGGFINQSTRSLARLYDVKLA